MQDLHVQLSSARLQTPEPLLTTPPRVTLQLTLQTAGRGFARKYHSHASRTYLLFLFFTVLWHNAEETPSC